MNKMALFFMILVITVFITEEYRIYNLQKSYDEISLYYSYSMDMLNGFFKDKDHMRKSLEAIADNPQKSV